MHLAVLVPLGFDRLRGPLQLVLLLGDLPRHLLPRRLQLLDLVVKALPLGAQLLQAPLVLVQVRVQALQVLALLEQVVGRQAAPLLQLPQLLGVLRARVRLHKGEHSSQHRARLTPSPPPGRTLVTFLR